MRKIAFMILLFLTYYSSAHERRILSFDLISKQVDTLNIPDFDTLLLLERTPFSTGIINDYYNNLDSVAPTENIIKGANYTFKRQVSKDYDVNNFPIRTSVRIFKWKNDSLKSLCSGSIISQKHVLTACHCVAKLLKDSLLYDSIFVCPVMDNGEYNGSFDCSWVKKIFMFENWNPLMEDFAVLELEKPIGEFTGWISIGFDADDSSLLDGIYYKFSYPALYQPGLDSTHYNGDTLYYSYGIADVASENSFGVKRATGIPGESGSSFIKVENEKSYTIYGVLSTAYQLNHSRLTNWKYYAIKSIIIDDVDLSSPKTNDGFDISIFPNPTFDHLNVICPEYLYLRKIVLYDLMGNKVLEYYNLEKEAYIDLSLIPVGEYILIGYTTNKKIVKKIIKQ